MEPITYCMGLGNLMIGYGAYAYRNQEFVLESVHESLVNRKRKKAFRRLGLDHTRLEELKAERDRLRETYYNLP
jgi:hypothetical protein